MCPVCIEFAKERLELQLVNGFDSGAFGTSDHYDPETRRVCENWLVEWSKRRVA